MDLFEKINEDIKEAMKAKEKEKLEVLRFLKSAVKDIMINEKKEINDEIVISIVSKQIKQSKDSLEEYEKGGREELVTKEKYAIEILQNYLPEQLSEEEALKEIEKILKENGINSKQDMGKAMKLVMEKLKGKVEGKIINQLVGKKLV